ncbi:HDOD domain-containing protein [Burkholderia ubonensis]|uniref:HDOD domain-containing protein n=1 Tax=Burkholderia ubonensis TaxID=101571 RepID=UPI000758B40B|nr:HDOD domain-containing protein [Burkholderia ubonensis]
MKKEKVLKLLWQRMQERGEFPALQQALNSIVSSMQDEMASNSRLAATVLGDFTLTQKVLRLANSPMYAPYARDVTTVSRALMILGSATVAYTAMGIQLLDTFEGLAESRTEAAEELGQASFAGKLARHLATKSGEAFGEEAAVATLMFQLSRLLVVFYFPEEWTSIRECLELGMSEEDAFLQVLGVTPDELSEAAMSEWSLPHPVIRRSSARPETPGALVTTHQEWLACIAGLSTELSHEFHRGGDEARVHELLEMYAPALGQTPGDLEELVLELFAAEREPEEAPDPEVELSPTLEGKPLNAEMRLSQALAEATSAADGADVSTLTQMVLESMMQGLGLAACAAFFRIPANKTFEARFGFGLGGKKNLNRMVFEDAFVPDVFHLALSQGRSIHLEDIQDVKTASRIPAWHKAVFPEARSIVLLPIRLMDRSIGLLYGNWGSQPCMGGVTTKEFDYLHAMRNLVGKAFEEAAKAPLGAFSLVDAPRKRTRRTGA